MAKYMIEMPHTNAECLRAMDEISAQGKEFLAKTQFACGVEPHISFTLVDAENKQKAEAMVPKFLRAKAKVFEVETYTQDEIRAYHEEPAQPSTH
jgi:hypothetical protein